MENKILKQNNTLPVSITETNSLIFIKQQTEKDSGSYDEIIIEKELIPQLISLITPQSPSNETDQ